MRQIKFKAWDNQGKKFIENEFAMSWCNGKVINIVGVSYNKHEEDDPYEDVTFCQFTGLKGKNGVDIYEGDILKSPFFEDMNVAVIWDDRHAQFTFGDAEFNVEVKPEDIEVLGNIYENKDLLTK